MRKRLLLKWLNWWPPFLGAGIRVKKISPDFLTIDVEMKLHFWNKNYIGTHFGGSLYSMCDPFYMLILYENLGPQYRVLDKAGSIRYKKLAKGRVHATFSITKEKMVALRMQADTEEKIEALFTVEIFDSTNTIVAEVDKLIYIRRKDSRFSAQKYT
jgi:hypothetical protein